MEKRALFLTSNGLGSQVTVTTLVAGVQVRWPRMKSERHEWPPSSADALSRSAIRPIGYVIWPRPISGRVSGYVALAAAAGAGSRRSWGGTGDGGSSTTAGRKWPWPAVEK